MGANDEKSPLGDYRPLKTGWQRNNELPESEIEKRGRLGLVIILLVIIALVITFGFYPTLLR